MRCGQAIRGRRGSPSPVEPTGGCGAHVVALTRPERLGSWRSIRVGEGARGIIAPSLRRRPERPEQDLAVPSTDTRAAARIRAARAFLLDLDGVLTPTVDVHMRAWGRLFTPFLHARGVAPYTVEDYYRLVDGRPRADGVRAVLADRGIRVPEGAPDDPPEADTVQGLGNRKNLEFTAELAENGIAPYPGSLRLLDALAPTGIRVAVVTSSRNGAPVLEAAQIADRVEVLVDGNVAADGRLRGKPAPDAFLEAARRLGLDPEECVVFEDALSGVAAGRAGGFGLVVGVDRGAGADALVAHGADLAVADLAELLPWLPGGSGDGSTAA